MSKKSNTFPLVQVSQQGLSENKHFTHHYWDDMICRLVSRRRIAVPALGIDQDFCAVEGPFWDYWLEHRYASAGYNPKKPSECWSRSLSDALKDNKGLDKKLFSPVVREFPAHWWEAIAVPEPGLCRIEDLYRRHLPVGYKGLGRLSRRINANSV